MSNALYLELTIFGQYHGGMWKIDSTFVKSRNKRVRNCCCKTEKYNSYEALLLIFFNLVALCSFLKIPKEYLHKQAPFPVVTVFQNVSACGYKPGIQSHLVSNLNESTKGILKVVPELDNLEFWNLVLAFFSEGLIQGWLGMSRKEVLNNWWVWDRVIIKRKASQSALGMSQSNQS